MIHRRATGTKLISERTKAGLASARARGRNGGAPFKMIAAKLRLAMASMGQPKTKTKIADLCRELKITRQTLYRHVGPDGTIREDGRNVLHGKRR
jgi:DNA invertase Pin-like site-specific DNA recombinase